MRGGAHGDSIEQSLCKRGYIHLYESEYTQSRRTCWGRVSGGFWCIAAKCTETGREIMKQ